MAGNGTLGSATTTEVAPVPAPLVVGWAKGAVEWTTADGVYTQGAGGQVKGPLTAQPGGSEVGWLMDKFGINWMVSIDKA